MAPQNPLATAWNLQALDTSLLHHNNDIRAISLFISPSIVPTHLFPYPAVSRKLAPFVTSFPVYIVHTKHNFIRFDFNVPLSLSLSSHCIAIRSFPLILIISFRIYGRPYTFVVAVYPISMPYSIHPIVPIACISPSVLFFVAVV